MEKELRARLAKLSAEFEPSQDPERDMLMFSKQLLEAVRAHIQELHPADIGDILALDETLEILKDYR